MIKTQPNADRSEGVSKNRKELEKELIDRELQFELEEEKKLDNYDSFVDEKDYSIHEDKRNFVTIRYIHNICY